MPYEIVNSLRSKSFVRVIGNTATTITLSNLAKDSTEIVSSASITHVSGVTDGIWRVYRGDNTSGVLILELPTFSHFQLQEFDTSIANNSTSNVHITNSGTVGTLILQFSKTATYSPALP